MGCCGGCGCHRVLWGAVGAMVLCRKPPPPALPHTAPHTAPHRPPGELNVGGVVAAVVVLLTLLGLIAFGLWFAYSRGHFREYRAAPHSPTLRPTAPHRPTLRPIAPHCAPHITP